MNEHLLQFIWQFQHFNKQELRCDDGEALQVVQAGTWNRNQGPDFLNACVKIGHTTWVGHVEVHVLASDWHRHQHEDDANYRNVILHVVWENDRPLERMPTLTLKPRVAKVMLQRYGQLIQQSLHQPCRSFLPALSTLGWEAWKERLAVERLQQKAIRVQHLLQDSLQHWDEVFWWMLASNFGIPVNQDAFESMARTIPFTIIARHKHQLIQLEALLMGQCHLLEPKFTDAYPLMLQKEYRYLRNKYRLAKSNVIPQFLRMRPANFPTVRLSQLAMLLHRSGHLFSTVRNTNDIDILRQLLDTAANDYWHYRYRFDEESEFKPKQLGRQMADNIIINTIAPLMFCFGITTGHTASREQAVHWLQQLPAEQNAITREWKAAGVMNRCAMDSQALIQLSHNYCDRQRCLECAVGNRVLKGE